MGLCDMNNTLEKVTVISGCVSVQVQRKEEEKEKSERLKEGSHTCMRPVLNHENSQTVTDTRMLSSLLGCIHQHSSLFRFLLP